MHNFKRYTLLVLGVSITIAVTGVAVYVLVPARLAQRSDAALERKAARLSEYVAERVAEPLAAGKTASVRAVLEVTRSTDDIAYVAVVDAAGGIVAAVGPSVEGRDVWPPGGPDVGQVVKSTSTMARSSELLGHVHVGIDRNRADLQAAEDHDRAMGFGIFLLLLAAGAGFSVWQMHRLRVAVEEWQMRHRNLRMQTGTLQSSVKEHRQTEQALRASEEKYRSLFQNAMASAMRDLEELNRNLEKRKEELEKEVAVRKRAESALVRYTERLKMMNEVERTMLEGESLGASVDIALKRLMGMLPLSAAAMYEVETARGRAIALGRMGDALDDSWQSLGPEETFLLADGRKDLRHEADARRVDSAAAPMMQRFREAGIFSWCFVPLVIEEETVGLLLMASREAGAFGEEAFGVGRDLGDLMAIGIRQSRLNSDRERYESELIAAKERAEEMARVKSAFLTNMSHEIRTPISGIMGFAQVLHEEAPQALREFTSLIQESATRLLNTINAVLELARLESGRERLDLRPIDLGAAVSETARLLEPLAQRKGIRLFAEQPPTGAMVRLDRGCLERVVNNLVGNAIKFTERGEVRVRIETDARHARLVVEDTGVGIAPEFVPNLFDEFRQEQMEANREHEGSGLGLAITKKLVDRLGGFITVATEKGRGSRFTVQFPLDRPAGDAGHREVLVVAAHPDAADALSEALGDACLATKVSSVEAGAELLESARFHAVVIDVNGTVPTDMALVRSLRGDRPELRLVAVATQILPEDVDGLVEAGFDLFVGEPFVRGRLRSAVSPGGVDDRSAIRREHRDRVTAPQGVDRRPAL